VTVENADGDVSVSLTGWENEVRIDEGGGAVDVYFVGRDNRVSVAPHVDATVVAEAGYDNAVESDPVPPSALVETSKAEAFGDATFGRHRVTYRNPAGDVDVCPNPGASAARTRSSSAGNSMPSSCSERPFARTTMAASVTSANTVRRVRWASNSRPTSARDTSSDSTPSRADPSGPPRRAVAREASGGETAVNKTVAARNDREIIVTEDF